MGAGYGVYQLATNPEHWGWIGVLLACLPFLLIFVKAFLFHNIARTREHMICGAVGVGVALSALLIGASGYEPLWSSIGLLAGKGVKILFISPQNQKHTADLAKKFDVPCEFLSDNGNQAADKLGIAADGGLPIGIEAFGYDSDTVLPTAVIIDVNGKIIYSDQTTNYRVRPEPQEYLKILEKH